MSNILVRHKMWDKTPKTIALPKEGDGIEPGDLHESPGFVSMVVDPGKLGIARIVLGHDAADALAVCFQHTRTLVACLARSRNNHRKGSFTNQVLLVFNAAGKTLMVKQFGTKSRVIREELEPQLQMMVEQAVIIPF